jgi:ABC-type transport system substrate-binding protein
MVYGAEAGGAAVAAAIAQAIKASGAIVQVEPSDFNTIVSKIDKPLVVQAQGGVLKTNYQYLTGYKGLVFFTKSPTPLMLPGDTELIAAKKIWVPG